MIHRIREGIYVVALLTLITYLFIDRNADSMNRQLWNVILATLLVCIVGVEVYLRFVRKKP